MTKIESQEIEAKTQHHYLATFRCPKGHTTKRSVVSYPNGRVEPAAIPCNTHGKWMCFTGGLEDLRGTDHPGLF